MIGSMEEYREPLMVALWVLPHWPLDEGSQSACIPVLSRNTTANWETVVPAPNFCTVRVGGAQGGMLWPNKHGGRGGSGNIVRRLCRYPHGGCTTEDMRSLEQLFWLAFMDSLQIQ